VTPPIFPGNLVKYYSHDTISIYVIGETVIAE